jgi:carbon storage regulator
MLVLSRKIGEKIVIGSDVTITVVAVQGNKVRIGIDAPDHVTILRGELTADRPAQTVWAEVETEDLAPST